MYLNLLRVTRQRGDVIHDVTLACISNNNIYAATFTWFTCALPGGLVLREPHWKVMCNTVKWLTTTISSVGDSDRCDVVNITQVHSPPGEEVLIRVCAWMYKIISGVIAIHTKVWRVPGALPSRLAQSQILTDSFYKIHKRTTRKLLTSWLLSVSLHLHV